MAIESGIYEDQIDDVIFFFIYFIFFILLYLCFSDVKYNFVFNIKRSAGSVRNSEINRNIYQQVLLLKTRNYTMDIFNLPQYSIIYKTRTQYSTDRENMQFYLMKRGETRFLQKYRVNYF